MRITLASPPCEVLLPPRTSRTYGRPGRAALTAGTLSTERDAVDGVAADPAVLDKEQLQDAVDRARLDDVNVVSVTQTMAIQEIQALLAEPAHYREALGQMLELPGDGADIDAFRKATFTSS